MNETKPWLNYRLYLINASGGVETGRPDASDARGFVDIDALLLYVATHGETAVQVATAEEAYRIVGGLMPIPGTTIIVGQPFVTVPDPGTVTGPAVPIVEPPNPDENAPLPVTLKYPFAPAVAIVATAGGGPVVTAVVVVASIIGSIFGFFGHGINKATKRALDGLAGAIANVGMTAVILASKIARALGKVLKALGDLWNKVILPALRTINRLASKLVRIIDRILKPMLAWQKRIHDLVMKYYIKLFVPVLDMLQKIRKALALLKILRVPGIKKLDDKLRQMEAKLIAPIAAILRRVNEHGWFINVLLNAKMLLSRDIFGASTKEYVHDLAAVLWDSQIPKEDELPAPGRPILPQAAAAESRDQFVTLARTGGGPMLLQVDAGKSVFKQQVARR